MLRLCAVEDSGGQRGSFDHRRPALTQNIGGSRARLEEVQTAGEKVENRRIDGAEALLSAA